ncbi:MAG: hypothetical protein KC484_09070 [Colwelliaceae bacterium]|nr:hypothetical protein [Colwelliaceae bacterium]
MTLFSWFKGTKKSNPLTIRSAQIDKKISSFNASTMWPTAHVRRNVIVKQQQMTDAIQDKESKQTSYKKNKDIVTD